MSSSVSSESSKTVKSTKSTISRGTPTSLPRVATLKKKPITVNSPHQTILPCGEKVNKNHKCLVASGSIEELIGHIGLLKATHFDIEDSKSMFTFARLTKIQEDLQLIIRSITTSQTIASKHTNTRFSMDKIQEIEESIHALNVNPFSGIIGSNVIGAQIYIIWAIVRRCERQINSARDLSLGIVVDDSILTYLNRLGDYFLCLITKVSNR